MKNLWDRDFDVSDGVLEKARSIKLLLLDVDGILTDGCIRLTEPGEEIKVFNGLDGHGIKMVQTSGVDVGVITARNSAAVAHRMSELGVRHLYQGQKDKRSAFSELLDKTGIQASQTAFAGDDIIDLGIMRQCGLAVAVPNAHSVVRQLADWQTSASGGQGAVREVCDMLMIARGTYNDMVEPYLV